MAFEGDKREHDDGTAMPSERKFGLTFAVIFLLIGLVRVPFGGNVRWWAVVVSGVFFAVTYIAPQFLTPLNRLWFRLGLLLHKIVNPLVLGAVYFVVLVPMAMAMQAFGKRFLALEYDASADSYWIPRDPPGPESGTMRNQF